MTERRRMFVIALILALAGAGTAALKPAAAPAPSAPDLEALLPDDFGAWRRIPLAEAILPSEVELGPGEAVAYRAYEDELGRVVTLAAAYGPPLGDSVRLHRPEACYVAQGFAIRARKAGEIGVGAKTAPVVHLDAESPSRREAVTYWLRDGGDFTSGPRESAFLRLARASALDGALVRVSTIGGDAPSFALHREFLEAFVAALAPEARAVLLGEGTRS